MLKEVLGNAEYQRKRSECERLYAEAAVAQRWYEATDTRAHLVEALALRRRAHLASRELGEIVDAIERRLNHAEVN